MVDLTLDDSPLDKGKQVVRVEEVDAVDQAGPSAAVDRAGAAGQVGPSAGPESALAGPPSGWPDIAALALARAEEEIPRWGDRPLSLGNASNPDADPVFALNDADEVHHWEYLEGLRRHLERSLHVAMEALSRGMWDATEVSLVWRFFFAMLLLSFCSRILWFSNRGQELKELKERSCQKSLFIRNESGVWAALAQQRALVEEANKRLSDQCAQTAELHVAYAAVKEEAVQAWAAEAVARVDVTRAQEEAAKAREDLMPLSARVKELEEDVALVGRQCDTLNVQIGQVTARFGALKDEVAALSGAIQQKDAALSSACQEIETLRAAVRDRDDALKGLERTCGGLRDEIMGLQTHTEGKYWCYGLDVEAAC
jgi:predicted  nucleic acid-binding Zn-ribbon protein